MRQQFIHISFTRVYRERNGVADQLSKEATQLEFGIWKITVHSSKGSYSYYHRPFHEAVLGQH